MTGRVWRTFQGAVILVVIACVGLVVVLAIVGRSIDAHQKAKEISLVELSLDRAKTQMAEDLLAATIWDEATSKLAGPLNADWIDHHMGPLYADQGQHVATLVYDAQAQALRASRNAQPVALSSLRSFAAAAAPMVASVRVEAAKRDRSTFARTAVRLASGVVAVDGTVYQMSVSSVVRHTNRGLVPEADPLVASFKPFEVAVTPLGESLGLANPSFQPGADLPANGANMAEVAVRDPDSRVLGHIVWRPEAPGARILRRVLPILAALTLAMGLAGLLLFQRIAADIRRLHESEAALVVALERAEAGSAAKSRFLANVSHELRTPLNGVLGMAEVIERDLLTPQQRDRMALLKASGRAQLRLIENLLFITRLQSDAVSITWGEISPADILARTVETWEPVAAVKGLSLAVRPGGPAMWSGDAAHIERMLDALVDNALRVTSDGSVVLRATQRRRQLVLEVADTGPGLTADRAARLLAPQAGDMPDADGAGMGLPIVSALASMMGGTVEAGRGGYGGAVIRLVLPRTLPRR